MGALACYLATHPRARRGEVEEESLRAFLEMAARVASHSVMARGTQTSFNVDNLPRELLVASYAQ